jgi:hypothetical protein
MPKKSRLALDSNTYQSLRSQQPNNVQSLHNLISAGLLVAHLIEREYSVYARVNQAQELVIRIYDAEDKYELIIYPYEDAREVILNSCGRFGGKDDLTLLLARVGFLVEALIGAQSADKKASLPEP